MDSIGIVIYCQGFILPQPYGNTVREMRLCELSGDHRKVFAYDKGGPAYTKLSPEAKTNVDEACKQPGVPYEPKFPARSSNRLTRDFDEFVAEFAHADRPDVGVWAGDAVARAFMEGLGVSTVVIEHNNLQTLPLGSVMSDDERFHNRDGCSGHWLRKPDPNEDEDSYLHWCSLEFVFAFAALVRKETHYRSPTIVSDLLSRKIYGNTE